MKFKDLGLRAPEVWKNTVKVNDDLDLAVRAYLPIDAKADLITWVLSMSIDERTGCISPIRLETFFSLAIMKWYADIEIDIQDNMTEIYDILEQNKVIDKVMKAIPEDEIVFMRELVTDTAEDVARYNNSFMGMMSAMSKDADDMDDKLSKLTSMIKNSEGLEQLAVIKDVVGTD